MPLPVCLYRLQRWLIAHKLSLWTVVSAALLAVGLTLTIYDIGAYGWGLYLVLISVVSFIVISAFCLVGTEQQTQPTIARQMWSNAKEAARKLTVDQSLRLTEGDIRLLVTGPAEMMRTQQNRRQQQQQQQFALRPHQECSTFLSSGGSPTRCGSPTSNGNSPTRTSVNLYPQDVDATADTQMVISVVERAKNQSQGERHPHRQVHFQQHDSGIEEAENGLNGNGLCEEEEVHYV